MRRTCFAAAALSGLLLTLVGCSASGAAFTAIGIGKNLKNNRLGIRIWVDEQEAKRNELKQAATGYSRWKIKEDVTTSPDLKFEFKEPGALGRISTIVVSIYQKHEANYSDQAEYTIIAAETNNPEAQMKPDTVYDLGNLGEGFKILDWKNQEVDKVELKPGWEYMMNITVKADDSETAQIFFKTT